MSFHAYTGAFVRMPKIDVITEQRIKTCFNPSCSQQNKQLLSNFCPECGLKIEILTQTAAINRFLSLNDLDKIRDADWVNQLATLEVGHEIILISNQHKHTGFNLNPQNHQIHAINGETILEMIANFLNQLESLEFFEIIQAHYEIKPVVEFGSFSYYQ